MRERLEVYADFTSVGSTASVSASPHLIAAASGQRPAGFRRLVHMREAADHPARGEERARRDHRIRADPDPVADQGTELVGAGVEDPALMTDADGLVGALVAMIGDDRARL